MSYRLKSYEISIYVESQDIAWQWNKFSPIYQTIVKVQNNQLDDFYFICIRNSFIRSVSWSISHVLELSFLILVEIFSRSVPFLRRGKRGMLFWKLKYRPSPIRRSFWRQEDFFIPFHDVLTSSSTPRNMAYLKNGPYRRGGAVG